MLQHSAIVVGHHFHEVPQLALPVVKDSLGYRTVGVLQVVFQQVTNDVDVFGAVGRLEADHLVVAEARELARIVVDVGDASAHARGKVAAGRADDHDPAAGHIFAPVVAAPFDDRLDARVANAEAFAYHAAKIQLAL